MMQIVVASDHAGYEMKEWLRKLLEQAGHTILDLGSFDPTQPDDYPDYAEALGIALQQRRAERGILICGSGVGASVAANKLPGIRAGLCHDHYSAHQGVEHDDMNVLVMDRGLLATRLQRISLSLFSRPTLLVKSACPPSGKDSSSRGESSSINACRAARLDAFSLRRSSATRLMRACGLSSRLPLHLFRL